MKRVAILAGCCALMLAAPDAAPADPWKDESGHGHAEARGDRGGWHDRDWRRDDRRGHPRDAWARDWRPGDGVPPFDPRWRERAEIPAGHLPPPGECRVWDHDRPPGHQSPPFRC